MSLRPRNYGGRQHNLVKLLKLKHLFQILFLCPSWSATGTMKLLQDIDGFLFLESTNHYHLLYNTIQILPFFLPFHLLVVFHYAVFILLIVVILVKNKNKKNFPISFNNGIFKFFYCLKKFCLVFFFEIGYKAISLTLILIWDFCKRHFFLY